MIYLYFAASHFLHFPRAAYDIGFTFLTTPVVSCTTCMCIYTHNAQSLSLQFAFIWNKDAIKQGVGDAGKYR